MAKILIHVQDSETLEHGWFSSLQQVLLLLEQNASEVEKLE